MQRVSRAGRTMEGGGSFAAVYLLPVLHHCIPSLLRAPGTAAPTHTYAGPRTGPAAPFP